LSDTDRAVFTVQVKVIGRFRQLVGQPHFAFEVQEGDTVQALIDKLDLPSDAPDLWVLVDHVPATRDHLLAPDKVVTFFQPIAGG
jgi:molybdopterin converting factor small subunit